MTQTQPCVVIPHTEEYIVVPETGEIILPPRSDVPVEDLPPPDDIFFYGWREVEYWVDGIDVGARIPLTLEDVLHPQPEDRVSQNKKHFELCDDLYDGMKAHVGHEQGTVVLHDMLINWGLKHIKGHAPDLAVIRGVRVFFEGGIFYLKRSKGHVVLVLEVTSPSTRLVDVEGKRNRNKVKHYAKIGIPVYIITDAVKWKPGYPPPIIVLLLGADGNYHKQTPDSRGWFWIDALQVWIGPYQDWVAWYDKNEIKLNTHIESEQARKLAEDKARDEAEARKLAEDKARLAEDKMRDEAEARKRAEDRIRELEALLAASSSDHAQ